jgi:hypothetical protein
LPYPPPPLQILLVNGLSMGSRTKKDVLDRMPPLHLFSPVCVVASDGGSAASPPGAGRAEQPPAGLGNDLLDAGALAALQTLGWVNAEAVLPGQARCGGSCCALPAVRIEGQGGSGGPAALAACSPSAEPLGPPVHEFQQQLSLKAGSATVDAAVLHPSPAQPADSQATLASLDAAACCKHAVQSSPAAVQQRVGAESVDAARGDQAEEVEGEEEVPKPPAWLVEGLARVGQRSQGSRDALAAGQLLGRRCACTRC